MISVWEFVSCAGFLATEELKYWSFLASEIKRCISEPAGCVVVDYECEICFVSVVLTEFCCFVWVVRDIGRKFLYFLAIKQQKFAF